MVVHVDVIETERKRGRTTATNNKPHFHTKEDLRCDLAAGGIHWTDTVVHALAQTAIENSKSNYDSLKMNADRSCVGRCLSCTTQWKQIIVGQNKNIVLSIFCATKKTESNQAAKPVRVKYDLQPPMQALTQLLRIEPK